MKNTLVLLLLFTLTFSAGSVAQSCGIWNGIAAYGSGVVDNTPNFVEHSQGGKHVFTGSHLGSCVYQNPPNGTIGSTCITTARAIDTPTGVETPPIDISLQFHQMRYAQKGGTNSGVGAVSTSAEAGVGVESCLKVIGCNFTVSLGPSGVTVSSGGAIWTDTDSYNGAGCPSEVVGCPIIIDTANEGFQLTDARDGVVTDMVIPGHRMQFGWTRRGSHNAFLWLDNHLFGNYTEQPPSDDPNGFAALAVYDSNHDGVIDSHDPVFSKLRLWIDKNHDGVTQPDELSTLPELGVYSISLHYKTQRYFDANGNLFRYRSTLQGGPGEDHTVYDVFLASDLGRHATASIKDNLN